MKDDVEASCRTCNPIDDCCQLGDRPAEKCWQTAGLGSGAKRLLAGRRVLLSDDRGRRPTIPNAEDAEARRDMSITLKEELMMNSYKTIDGRGVNVEIANGPCIAIQGVTNIIVHGIYIHDCVQAGNAIVTDAPQHYECCGASLTGMGSRYLGRVTCGSTTAPCHTTLPRRPHRRSLWVHGHHGVQQLHV